MAKPHDDALRNRRSLIAVSGVVLAVATVVVVAELDPPEPILLPAIVAPCLCGIAFAVIGATAGQRGLEMGAIVLRVVALFVVVSGAAVMYVSPSLGILELLVGMLFLTAVGVRELTERRVSTIACLFGVLATIAFAVLASVPFASPAVYAALGGSLGLAMGGLRWILDRSPAQVPQAVARFERGPGAR